MVTDAPMISLLKIKNNVIRKVKVQFRRTGAKLTKALKRISNIRTTSNVDKKTDHQVDSNS